jgi:hypothetical protein
VSLWAAVAALARTCKCRRVLVPEASVDAHQVHQKRQIGVYFALFAMALICAGRWAESETHPALQTRIDEWSTR